jgi:poly(beta-D-mannuronate) lyase
MKRYLLAISIFIAGNISANTITVRSIADLQTAINKAEAGDVITVANGVYTTTADIAIDRKGTAKKPIIIASQGIGGAEITGAGGFNISGSSTYIIIKGFKFTHQPSRAKTAGATSFCRFTQNIFETPGDGEDLTIAGSDHEVDYNTFQNKNAMGRFIAIRGTGKQIAERLWIHHNYLKSHKDQGGKNGAEAFQFGLSGFSLSSSNSIVEYNLLEDCAGENELISIKASAVTLRYNTIRNCPAQFTLRHGNHCQVYGNYFYNTPGLRIFGDDHVIFSNYFENCKPAITIGNGGAEVADGAPLTSHDRPDRDLIAFNTLVNNAQNIVMTARKDGLGATYITIANNLIQGGGVAASITGPLVNSQWQGNIIYNVKDTGSMPPNGCMMIDPMLEKKDGIFHLKAGSPAINKATGSYAAVNVDIDGQPRKGKLDIGADEFSKDKAVAKVLEPGDVGHMAGGKH